MTRASLSVAGCIELYGRQLGARLRVAGGIELYGRQPGARLRGCSLAVELLAFPGGGG